MKVLKNSVSNISFCGLVPKKSYNGPLLNLTDADKTKIAALQENRRFIGFEIEKKYFELAQKRIERFYKERIL